MDKMRILFIEAPYSYTASGKEVVGKYYPLGLGYLASYIRQFGYSVKIYQPSSEEAYTEDLKKLIESFAPAIVGISVMTPSYPAAVEICNIIGGHPFVGESGRMPLPLPAVGDKI